MFYDSFNHTTGSSIIAAIEAAGDKAFVLGTVVDGEKGVDLC